MTNSTEAIVPTSIFTRSAPFLDRIVLLCVPFTIFASSPSLILVWAGRAAIILAFAASFVSLMRPEKPDRVAWSILVAWALILLAGTIGGSASGSSQIFVQLFQILIVATILANQREIASTSTLRLTITVFALLSLAINLVFRVPPQADETHHFTQVVGAFGNPNVFAMALLAMALLSLSAFYTAGVQRRLKYAILPALLIVLIGFTEGRSEILALIAYFAVIAIGYFMKGNSRILDMIAAASLVAVPAVVFTYPLLLGHPIHFSAPVVQASPDAAPRGDNFVLAKPTCIQTTVVSCGVPVAHEEAKVDLKTEAVQEQLMGKNIASGRQNIWPAVIELTAEKPLFGYGLGSLPGSYLAWPYTGRSAHNGFLQVYFQFGLVGLLLYFAVWAMLFARAVRLPNRGARIAAVATLCAVCVLETFEVLLIQNNFGIGVSFAILMTTSLRPATPSALSL